MSKETETIRALAEQLRDAVKALTEDGAKYSVVRVSYDAKGRARVDMTPRAGELKDSHLLLNGVNYGPIEKRQRVRLYRSGKLSVDGVVRKPAES